MRKWLMVMACVSVLLGAEKSLEELEKENKILEMQLKNQELKKKLENDQKDEIKKQRLERKDEIKEAVAEALGIPKFKSKDEARGSLFGGWGLIGYSSMSFKTPSNFPLKQKIGSGFTGGFQLGGMNMWNRKLGLQAYLDFGGSMGGGGYSNEGAWHATTGVYTLNVDAILNPVNSDSFGIGFLLGLGGGLRQSIIQYSSTSNYSWMESGLQNQFEIGANIGLRLIFGYTFAMDFVARVPFTSTEISITKLGKTHTFNFRENVAFSLRLVGGRF